MLWVRSTLFSSRSPFPEVLSSFGVRREAVLDLKLNNVDSILAPFFFFSKSEYTWFLNSDLRSGCWCCHALGNCSYFLISKLIVPCFRSPLSALFTPWVIPTKKGLSMALMSDLRAIFLLWSQQSYYCDSHFCLNRLLLRFVFRLAE